MSKTTTGGKTKAVKPAATRGAAKPAMAPGKRKAGAAAEKARAEAKELKAALAEASGDGRRRGKSKDPRAQPLSAKDRADLNGVVIYLHDAAKKQFARLAIDEGRTSQELGVEAINLLFKLYGVRAIA